MIEDKKTAEPTTFIDVNSENLREVLKTVLEDVKGINLREDKLSVQQTRRRNLQKFANQFRLSRICYSTSSMNYECVIAQETLRTIIQHLLAELTLAY
jgi:hypothetical protein